MADTTQEQPVDAPVAAATVEGPPPAKRKLYDSMVKDKLYTKSFDAFNTQFSTPDKVNNLHSFLTQKGKYDKDANTFGSQFFSDVVKKKGLSEPGSNSGSSTSAAPSSTSQPTDNTPPPAPMVMPPNAIAPENVLSSVGDGTYAPAPYTPQTQAVIKQLENEQIAQEQNQKDLQASNVMQMLDDFKKNIPKAPDARQNDPTAYLDYLAKKPKSPKEEEFKGTTGDRIALGALTAQNNLYKGLGTAVTGLITAANFAAKTIIPANEVIEPAEWDKARDNLNAYVDKFTKGLQWEIEPKTQEQINGNPLQNAINQIANFVPAAIASESTAGQSFYYQGVGDANNQLQEMKAKGMKIDPGVADLYTQLMGVGNYYLMNKLNAHSLLSTFPAKLRNSAIGRASAETIKTLADKGAVATGQDIVNVFKNPIMGFGDRVAQLGLDAVKSYGHTAVDLAGLATYGHVINAGANAANQAKGGDEIFHQNPSDLIAQYRDILTSSAPAFTLFGAARTVVDNPGLLFHDSPYQNIVTDRLQKDSSPENIQKIKDDLATIGAQKQWSHDDIVNSQNTVDMVADVASKLPRELRADKFRDGVDLITHRRALETVLKETQAQKTNLDPAVQSRVSPFEDLLHAKIDQANDKLSTLVTDKAFTYYESNGQYFKKQQDSEPVEITKARYDLEGLENEYKPRATQSIVMPEGTTDKAGNPVPPKVDKDGPLPDNTDISDEDYNKFVDQDKVSPENIDNIAVKVRDKQPLSEREKAVFASRIEDINKSIKDSLQPEVAPKAKADGQTSKAAPAKVENTEKPAPVEPAKPASTVAKVDETVGDKNVEPTPKSETAKPVQKPVELPINDARPKPISNEQKSPVLSNEQEADRHWLENETNPEAIASRYHQENFSTENSADYKEHKIAEAFGTKSRINARDFSRFGDDNLLAGDTSFKRRWIDADNKSQDIDQVAQELTHNTDVEFTPQDIVDFVTKYSGKGDFEAKATSGFQTDLEQKYHQLTGKNLSKKAAEEAYNKSKAELSNARLNEDAVEIIDKEGINYGNVDKLRDMFKGFPYSEDDFNNVKRYLENERKQGKSEGEPGKNETPSPGAKSESSSQPGKETGSEGSTPAPGKTNTTKSSGAASAGKEIVKPERPATPFDTQTTDGQTSEANKTIEDADKLQNLKNINPDGGRSPKRVKDALGDADKLRFEELRKKLKQNIRSEKNDIDNSGDMSTGYNAELYSTGIELTSLYFKAGVHGFADYAREMISDMGEDVIPYLGSFYEGAKRLPGIKGAFDSTDTVDYHIAKLSETGDPVRVFVDRVKSEIAEGNKLNILRLEGIAAEAGLSTDTRSKLQDHVELALMEVARDITDNPMLDDQEKFNDLIKLYESQPSLLQRSSTSVALQQYSTPLPYSFAAGTYVNDITPGSIYDPTAGTGNLTIAFNPAIASVNEIDPGRLEILRQLGFAPTGEDAVTFNPGHSFAGIMANPPFGPSGTSVKFHDYVFGKLDYIIPLRALESMKDDGRAAIIIGGHNQYDKKILLGTDFKFLNYLYHYYNVSDVINVDGGLYAKQGTTFPTRLILVNGRKEVPAGYAPVEDEEANKPVKTYEQLYNRVQERIKNDEKPTVLQSKLDVQPQISLFDDGTGASGVQTGRTSGSRAVSNTSDNEVDRGRDEKPGAGDTTTGRQAGLERDVNRPDGNSEGDNEKQQLADVPESIAKFAPAAQSGSIGPETAGEFVPDDRLLQPARPSASEVVSQDKITYSPASRASQAGSVIPANMAYETEQNLKDLESLYGPIDAFVANELDYHDLTDLNNAFFAEQIDAIALAIHQLKNGQGMIIGDMTGIGKGRCAAGLLRWAVNQGHIPTFFTENADLFSDIYRDLHGIGSGHLIPFIVNDPSGDRDANIKRDGKIIYKANKIEDKRRFFETGKLPAGTNIVLSTYSQLNSEKQFLKRGFITKMTKGSFMFLDESHNVSGDSNSGKFFQDLLGEAKGATFFSATYAKRPDNMPVYALKTAMQDANMTTGALVEAIQTGGNALQEVVSSQLVKAGQMIRRERDFTDVVNQFDTIGTHKDGTVNEQGQKHRELADQVIEVCNSIITFEKDFVEKALGEIQAQLAKEGKRTKDTKSKQLSISNTPFASKMFNIVNQMLFSIKAPDIARIAIEELKAGNKPVIAFNSTMESFIKNNGYKPGDEIDDVSFSASLLNGLKNTLKYRVEFPNGDTEVRHLSLDDLDDEGRASWNNVVDMIKKASAEMSISPIDTIHEIIEAAGYKAGEITGRASKLKFSEDGKSARVESIGKKDTTGMITDFNGGGATQAILLNAAGATGFSMHADKSFRDQRERVMITGQLELDINKEIQKRGRIDRTNQVRRGRFRYVVSSIPAETRLLMMFRAKLKSLQANTTSSQKSKANDVDVVDFLNEYGDQVITDYLQQNPDTYQKLYQGADPAGLRDIAPGKTARPVEGIARKSTGRAALLTVDEQERFYNEVSQAYNDYIDYLNSIDQNTLEIKSLNLEAETLSKGVYIEGKHTNSPFGQDSMIEKVEANVLRKPLSKVELEEHIDKSLDGKTPTEASWELMRQVTDNYKTIVKRRLDNARELLDKRVKKDAEKYASNKALIHAAQKVHFDEFDKAEEEITNDADQARDKMVAMFRDYKVGTEHMVPTSIYGTEVKYTKGIFLGFSVKDENVYNKFTPSNILMKFAVLDGKRIISATVSRTDFVNALYAAKAQMSINELREMGNLRNHWDEEASKTKDKEIRHIITGNILQAFKPNMGQLASYTTSDGKIHKGIIMPKSFSPEKEGQLVSAVNMHDKIMALANEESVVSSDGTFEIEKFSSTHFGLNVPKATSKGGRYFKNQALLDLVNYSEFNTRGGKMVAGLPGYKMMDLLKVLEKEFNMKFKSGVEMHDVNPDPGDKPTGGGGSSSSKSNSLITPDSGELEYHERGQDFIHSKSTERIQAENHFPAGRPIKKLPEIISDLAKGLNVKIFHARSARKGAAGSYNPTSAGIKLKAINNLDVAVHEVGHALDDAFDLFNNIPAAVRSQVMDELQWFADRGGSNPPASMNAQSRMEYLKREGIAEFVRAYAINPTQAFRRAPEFFAHFEATLPDDVKEVLREFGNDYLRYNNGTNLDRIMANIEEVPKEQQAGFRKFLESFKSPVDGRFNLTFWDNVKTKFTNSMRPFEKGFNYLTMTAGHSVDNVLPEENASMLAQVFAGVDSKIGAVFADGLVTGKNEPIIDARTGRRMNMEWLYDAFDSTSPETLAQDQALTIGYLFAMRTVEKSMQFDRPEQISGISATGNDTDIDVAVNFLTKEFGTAIPREQRGRILEGARRYQLWSDKMLKYMVDKGRLSQANYRDIKSKNLEYVAFLPVQENEPGVETYFDSVSSLNRRANMGSVKTVIREMQGSTMFKRHPYVSLLQNTAAMIKEADRNEILQSFIEPMLTTMRNMGQGSINPFANVMIEVTQADKLLGKPVMSVYVNGNARYFMFSNDAKDIYDVVNGLSKLPQLPGIVTAIPRAIRFGVTRFPVFAVRNVIRDTFSRLIISRANSGFGSFLKDRDNDKELFQMFGGDQAGYYMGNKLDYYKLQSQIIKDLTHSGKATLANPVELTKKGWNWYEKLLQKGELTNRMAEFRASYTKAVTPKAEGGLGLDEYNANLWAAYQARDLMDFAVAGTWMRYINLMVPFANAQVQGLKREFKAATENGWKGAGLFAMKLALFTILPQLLMRMFSKVGDYEEEYDNLPSYQRDIFWNFKLPNGSWFIIPKPFSLGLPGAGIDRAIGGMEKHENAWAGYPTSLYQNLSILRPEMMAGPMSAAIEPMANYSFFKQGPIVPRFEENKLLELRKKFNTASRLSKGMSLMLSPAFKDGDSVDPRYIDNLFTSMFSYYGETAMNLSDIGSKESRQKFGLKTTGFIRDQQIYGDVRVSKLYDVAEDLGMTGSSQIKRLTGYITDYYNSVTPAERKEAFKQVMDYAKDVYHEWMENDIYKEKVETKGHKINFN